MVYDSIMMENVWFGSIKAAIYSLFLFFYLPVRKFFFLMRKNFFSVPPMRICPNGQKSQEKNLPQEALALFFILFLLNSFLLSLLFLFPTFFHLLFNFLPCIYSLFSPFLLFKRPPIARFPWLWLAPPPGGWWRWTWALPRCRGTGGRRRRNYLGRRKKNKPSENPIIIINLV